VTGAKEPPAKKSNKDCQKEYELHRKLQSFRNEWAIDRPWFCFSEGAMFCSSDDRFFEEFYIYSHFKG
jgi:hypothetical protein